MLRVVFKDNTALVDYSSVLENYYSGTAALNFVNGQDYLYIGSVLPFNHVYFVIGTANAAASVASVAVWDGTAWRDTVDIIDETSSSGASLAQSGAMTWIPSKHYGWIHDDTVDSADVEKITGLGDVTIYDRYWARINFSVSLDAGTTLAWAGNVFANDSDLGSEYPELVTSAVKTAFASGKTSWEEQHVRASELIIADSIEQYILHHQSQILDRRQFRAMAVSKCAQLIFAGLGNDALADKEEAMKEYERRLKKSFSGIDKDLDAREDLNEIGFTQGRIYR